MHWRRKWQPTPAFLPGESQGRGSLVGCRLWGRTESDTTEVTAAAAAALTLVLAFPTRIQFSPKKLRCKVLISHDFLLFSSSSLSLSHFEHTPPPPLSPGRMWHSGPETGEPGSRRMIQGSGFSTHPGSLLLVPTQVFLALVFISIWLTVDVLGSLG